MKQAAGTHAIGLLRPGFLADNRDRWRTTLMHQLHAQATPARDAQMGWVN
jgi:hypothetical protein